MKYIIGIVSVVLVAGGIWYMTSQSAVAPTTSVSPSAAASKASPVSPSSAPKVSGTPKASAAASPTITPTPAGTPTPTSGPATFTASQVAAHNSQTSCYAIISGSVYDLTSYMPIHPGGSRKILDICGKDGTALFDDQHAGQTKAMNALAALKIGQLAP